MRTDHVEHRRISWPPATSSQITKSPPALLSRVKHVGERTDLAMDFWQRTKLVDFCSYLEHHDHVQLRNLLATNTSTLAAAVARYSDSDRNIREINRIYYELRRNLWTHMFREEGLYSSICNVERHRVKAVCSSGIVTGAIRVMNREHRQFAKAFQRIAKLLRGYQIPDNAGQKYRDLVQGFRDLEAWLASFNI
jgi:iron-sulfur cluster repair protein YtfE (RIC family)